MSYGEGLFIGYRYYDTKAAPVLFPFGYGLSYTTFAYSNPVVSASKFRDVDGLTVKVDVTNTGHIAGKEIAEVYVRDRVSDLARPAKELKGFAKVSLEPGETKTVTVDLDFRAFAYWHPEYEQWITEDGDFDILIGASAADIRHTLTVTLESTLDLPCVLDMESTIREWMTDPRGKAVFGPFFAQMEEQSRRLFIGEDGDALGMNFIASFGDMPLMSVLMWQADALPMHPEDFVAGLLKQAHGQAN